MSAVYNNPTSRCVCGHNGALPTESYGTVVDVAHGGMLGHGACTVPGCACPKFTWVEFLPEYVASRHYEERLEKNGGFLNAAAHGKISEVAKGIAKREFAKRNRVGKRVPR